MNEEKILDIARLRPIQPSDVSKALSVDSIIAGALLSSLSAKKMLKVSYLKSGSSPFYFIPGNEAQLLSLLHYLNPKDKDTVNIIQEKKVLRASKESPLIRVSLQQIKDFAIPLEVTQGENKEIFYKWFLLKDDEAIKIIEGMIKPKTEEKEEPKKEEIKEKKESQSFVKSIEKSKEEIKETEEKKELKEEKKKTVEKKIEKKEIHKENVKEEKVQQNKLVEKKDNINNFFANNKISIIQMLNKRLKETEQIISLPTVVGNVKFYCKVLTKAKINDSDISNVLVNAQLKKLPGLILYSGQLTTKAGDLIKKIPEVIIKKLENGG